MHKNNIYSNLPKTPQKEELSELLHKTNSTTLTRIISTGQSTPKDKWYNQPQDEWVILLKGNATLLFENNEELTLEEGDYILIPAHKPHKVKWTDPNQTCIWLAFHADPATN